MVRPDTRDEGRYGGETVEGPRVLSAGVLEPTAGNYARFLGWSPLGLEVEERTPAEMAGDLAAALLALRTIPRDINVENPTATDSYLIGSVPVAATVVEIYSVTDAGTVTFNVEKRGKFAPHSAGTDVMASDQVADTGGESETTFAGGSTAIAAGDRLHLAASAMSGAGWLHVTVVYRVEL
jgi:hypothetical protein